MQYHPKLKMAAEDIKKILEKYDISGAVSLHTPGFAEFLIKVDPSYSCAWFEGDNLRIRARLKEDFNGDKQAWTKKVSETTNMLLIHAENLRILTDGVTKTVKMLKQHIQIEFHGGDGPTSHTQQNN